MKRLLGGAAGLSPVVIVLLAFAVAIVAQTQLEPGEHGLALGLTYLVSGLAVAWAMARRPIAPATPLPRWLEVVALTTILLVAAFFRLTRLATAPEGVWFDEAQNGLVAMRILQDPSYRPVFVAELTQLPALFFYLQAVAIQFFGANIFALRLVATLLGLAAVGGVYFLARLLFGVPVAIVAGLLLASERWHVNFSRFAMNGILVPALSVGAVYFAIRGLRTGRLRDLGLAGLFLALGAYSYPAFYIVPVLLAIVFLVMLARERLALLRRTAGGLVALVVVGLLVLSPLIGFAIRDSRAFGERTQTTSIFRDKTPEQARAALTESVRAHVLMFHVTGDRNGRHNLPGAPMIDPITGALLALGLVVALSRVRRPEYALLVAWLVLAVLPGVLSLDFEAPQAYRGIGATVPVALLAALVPGWLLARAWESRPRWRGALVALPAAATLAVIVGLNYDQYFNRQLTDFSAWAAYSTSETLMARSIAALPAETQVYISDNTHSTPTLRFLLGENRVPERFDPAQHLPIRGEQPVALYLLPEPDKRRSAITSLYPAARIVEHPGPTGGESVVTAIHIDREQIAAVKGVTAQYFAGDVADPDAQPPAVQRAEPALAVTWEEGAPLPAPFTARWKSTLALPQFGKYRFRVEGPPATALAIDGADVVRGDQDGVEVTLAQGHHALALRTTMTTLTPVRVLWQPPGTRGWQPLPREHLFVEPVAARGLLGVYYASKTWTGTPSFHRIDPAIAFRFHNPPLPRPWSVEWSGQLAISTPGLYRFSTESIDPVQLTIGDRVVIATTRLNERSERQITLTAGLHPIKVRYQDESGWSHLAVYWQPPGGEREVIPSERLIPMTVTDPRVLTLPPAPPAPAATAPRPVQPVATTLVPAASLGGAERASPRGVALDAAGNSYVVDTINRQVRAFDPTGAPRWSFGPGAGDEELMEPVAVVVAGNGEIVVLDSKQGRLHRYDAAGKPLGRIGGTEGRFFQPRGFAMDAGGDFYLADTGNGRIAVVNAQGELTAKIGEQGLGEGQIKEPTDVVIDRYGSVFIADSANKKMVAYAADGSLRAEWPIPTSSSVIGPHLAADGRGGVYVTDPDHGMIRQYGASGEVLAEIGPLEADGEPVRRPMGIVLVAPDTLVVTDLESRRVIKVALTS
jgi:DNA-binding beta-propeller fold protein YncE/4-amino-4-deoxy-L-arabinose transferase-like glycosyltransferase